MKATLYCVCNEAEVMVCDRCPKYKRIQPDHTLNNPTWRREARQQ